MIKNLQKFIRQLKEKGVSCRGSIVSQILKNERIKRNLTLNELAEGVCSVSYLSKLENCLIKSNDLFYTQLFEKMDIDFNMVNLEEYENLLEEVIKYYFLNDYDNIYKIYNELKSVPNNTNISLVNCFYYLKNSEYDLFMKSFNELSEVKECLGYFEGITYIYLAIAFYIQNYNFEKALDYLHSIEMLEINNRYLNYLLIEANIYVSAMYDKPSRLLVYYNKLNDLSFIGYPNGKRIEMRLLYNLVISDEFLYDALEEIETINFNEIPDDNRFNVLYYIYLIKLKTKNYKYIFEDIYKKGYFIESRFLGLMGYCAYWLNDDELYKTIFDIVSNYTFNENDAYHQQFICFLLMYSSNTNDNDLISYLRNEVVGQIKNRYLYLYNEIFVDVYMGLLKKLKLKKT